MNHLKSIKQYTNVAIQALLGGVFLLSAVLKGVNLQGTARKIGEYGGALELPWLIDYSGVEAVLLCSVELGIGLLLLSFAYRRVALLLLVAVTTLFTLVLLYLTIALPYDVGDCGCFGEYFHLSVNESIGKNVAILLLAGYLLGKVRKNRRRYEDEKR